ncbi:Creatinase/aminopeptidase [Armillaria gallica]|uniref:Creatinase/aminopeptidase n=1 Tax=Armillaria gallica TaxID=47427 RepID=A0A2H3D175_ARMGA|nr:Creatinase/aminopeptidase [Armillaria gallica]
MSSTPCTEFFSPSFASLTPPSHCSHLGPPPASEFHARLSTLGETLTALNASAYIAEPGASALYYANVSSSHWHPSDGYLTIFGENTALPHGSGTDRRLDPDNFSLFDCTASLHGYWSDVTHTLALPASIIPDTHLQIWNFVRSAQNIAFQNAHAGVVAKRVDDAPRLFLGLAGYAKYFTHRLGHGIGLEVHGDPYLNGGSEAILQAGHTFSNEPGVYIEGKVGARLEDCFYIAQNGSAVYLTVGVGGPASSPWKP